MSSSPGSIRFRALTHEDMPLLHRWLNKPHVYRWWDDPPQPTLDQVMEDFGPIVEATDTMRGYLIVLDDQPIGFIQTYLLKDEPAFAEQLNIPETAAGVDLFIGEVAHVGHGVGSSAINIFIEEIVFADPGTTECIIDPHPDNDVAIRAYEKAGFRHLRTTEMPEYPWIVYLMRRGR